MTEIYVSTQKANPLNEFLINYGFDVEEINENILKVTREDELPVFISVNPESLYFEVDICGTKDLNLNEDFLYRILDLNTEILPVSVGINSSDPDNVRLVLIESRETGHLNDNELLAVFDALELAVDRMEGLLAEKIAE